MTMIDDEITDDVFNADEVSIRSIERYVVNDDNTCKN